MTLEHVVMAIVVVAVAVVAFLLGRARGVQLGEDEIDPDVYQRAYALVGEAMDKEEAGKKQK